MKLAIITMSIVMVNIAFADMLEFDCPLQMEGDEVAEYVLNAAPDMVQISKVSSNQAADLYHSLQKDYQHFLYVPSSHLFIASKDLIDVIAISSQGNDRSRGTSAELGVDLSWGDKEGPHIGGYVNVEVHDDKGNYVEGRVEQRDDGSGNASVRGGHEK